MKRDLTPEKRLRILRQADQLRKWKSLDDERVCVVCERIFKGHQVEIRRDQHGRYLLQCPTEGCPSFAAHWFYAGSAAHAAAAVLHDGVNGYDHIAMVS
jgi:hypothetical protein